MLLVVPDVVVAGRRYSAPAIAFALVLFGAFGARAKDVRKKVAVEIREVVDERRWRMLDRWVEATLNRRLFQKIRLPPQSERRTLRAAAASVVRQLASLSRLVVGPLDVLAMDGAPMAIAVGSAGNTYPPPASTPAGGSAIA